jgi:hypothetical protein
MMRRIKLLLVSATLFGVCLPAAAGGPLFVGGPSDAPGVPYRWDNSAPVPYRTDLGMLGTMTKQQADQFTAECFGVWHSVSTANISFGKTGDLSQDINAGNFLGLENDPNSELNRNNAIIYDADGSLVDALYGAGASSSILGFATITDGTSDGAHNTFLHATAVLNGKFIDGVSNPEISIDKFKEAFIHEFGHFAGLDHSQVNVEVLSSSYRDADRLAGLPTMFPFMLNTAPRPTLAPDDVAAISQLYSTANFANSTGTIRGRVLFSDGLTQAQGVNVTARLQDNPATPENESLRVAISSFSGFLFTGSAGNVMAGYQGSAFGSRDQSLIGYYEIPGLSQGSYSVEIEAVDSGFILGSGIGPIGDLGFQFPLPGPCTKEFLNLSPPESSVDDCTDKSFILITPGAVIGSGTDIILNGTAPSYDAWESGELWNSDRLIQRATEANEVAA